MGAERNESKEIAKSEFCTLFGLSEKQLERHFSAGMPHRKKGRAVFVPMPEARVWLHKYLEEKGKKAATPTDRSNSIDRRIAAEADLAEIMLAEKRKQLMTVEDYDRLVVDAFSRVRARLTNLAPRIAGIVLGSKTIQDAQARIDPIVLEVMDELRRADDVPKDDEDEDAAT